MLAGESGDGIPVRSRYDAFDLGRASVRSFGPESDDLRHAGHEVSPFRHKLYGHAHGVLGKEELFFEEELALVYRGAYVPSLPYGIGRQVYEYGSCYGGFLLRSGYSFAIAVEHLEPDVYVRIGFVVRAGESHDGLGVPFLGSVYVTAAFTRPDREFPMRMFLWKKNSGSKFVIHPVYARSV